LVTFILVTFMFNFCYVFYLRPASITFLPHFQCIKLFCKIMNLISCTKCLFLLRIVFSKERSNYSFYPGNQVMKQVNDFKYIYGSVYTLSGIIFGFVLPGCVIFSIVFTEHVFNVVCIENIIFRIVSSECMTYSIVFTDHTIFVADYLLSNNHVNSIIVHKFDFSDEEVMAYYISFLKTLSLKLNAHTIHFFYNEVRNSCRSCKCLYFYNHCHLFGNFCCCMNPLYFKVK
jgi:hypothetical protein